MKLFFILYSLFIVSMSYPQSPVPRLKPSQVVTKLKSTEQSFTGYKIQIAKSVNDNWEWGVFDECEMPIKISGHKAIIGTDSFNFVQIDMDGYAYSNCIGSWLTDKECYIYIHQYENGSKSLAIMYKDKIVRYLIK